MIALDFSFDIPKNRGLSLRSKKRASKYCIDQTSSVIVFQFYSMNVLYGVASRLWKTEAYNPARCQLICSVSFYLDCCVDSYDFCNYSHPVHSSKNHQHP